MSLPHKIICDGCGNSDDHLFDDWANEEDVRSFFSLIVGWLCTESGDYCPKCKEAHQ